jgi:hypothetical protein
VYNKEDAYSTMEAEDQNKIITVLQGTFPIVKSY